MRGAPWSLVLRAGRTRRTQIDYEHMTVCYLLYLKRGRDVTCEGVTRYEHMIHMSDSLLSTLYTERNV